jgi:hypothetical protein
MSKEQADLLIVLVSLVVIAAGILLAMRKVTPTPQHSRRVLRRWGVPAPSEEQGELAAAYFRQQQSWYPLLFLGFGVLCYFVIGADPFLILLVTVLAGLLIGELGAVLRPAFRSRRSAVLIRRGVTDLVPRFALVLYGFVAAVTLAGIVVNVIGTGFGAPYPDSPSVGLLLAGFLVSVAAGACAVWLSLFRGPVVVADGVVDSALRIRSARVATGISQLLLTGIGFVALGWMDPVAGTPPWMDVADGIGMWLGLALVPIAVVNWIALLNPARSSKLIEASRAKVT